MLIVLVPMGRNARLQECVFPLTKEYKESAKELQEESKLCTPLSSVTYPAIWRCHHISRGRCGVSYEKCGCEYGECAYLKEMIHLQ
jgi:hypothetical protein